MEENKKSMAEEAPAEAPAPSRSCCGGGDCSRCSRKGEPRSKLHCFNWLADVPGGYTDDDIVEVQFKNTRKGYFRNSQGLDLKAGDLVAVEGSPGHDLGEVSLTGALVRLQMRKAGVRRENDIKRIFRKARPSDIEKWEEAKARENDTMIRARKIAAELKLNMKIGDVEYQGDGNKAIFYYIADERVDFRQLIKVLADTFKVRIEMKQIGARQEAGRIGGIGPCGRPLCCSSWMSNFVSVGTAAARFQDLSLNPQKLAGQCAKLKCCLNFEVDAYVEASRAMPPKDARPETADNVYFPFKTDILRHEITYSTDKNVAANLVTISAERAFEVLAMNKAGEKPLSLLPDGHEDPKEKKVVDLVEQESLTRFDKARKKKRKGGKGPRDAKEGKDGKAPQDAAQGGASKQKQPQTPRQQGQKQPQQQSQGQVQKQPQQPQQQGGGDRRQRGDRRPKGQRQQPQNPSANTTAPSTATATAPAPASASVPGSSPKKPE